MDDMSDAYVSEREVDVTCDAERSQIEKNEVQSVRKFLRNDVEVTAKMESDLAADTKGKRDFDAPIAGSSICSANKPQSKIVIGSANSSVEDTVSPLFVEVDNYEGIRLLTF